MATRDSSSIIAAENQTELDCFVMDILPLSVSSISKVASALKSGAESCWFGNTVRNQRNKIDSHARMPLPARLFDKPGLMPQAALTNDGCLVTIHARGI